MDAFQFGLKVAEIMLPGAQPSSGMGLSGLSALPSSTLPPIKGPLTDDLAPGAASLALAKSMDPDPLTGAGPIRLTDADVAAARAQAASEQRNFYNPLQASGRDHILDWAANTKPVQAADIARQNAELEKIRPGAHIHDWSKGPTRAQTLYDHFVTRPKQTLKDYGEMGRAFAAGFSPKVNPVTGFIDRATDPNIGFRGAVAHATGADNPNSFVSRTGRAIDNAYSAAQDIKQLTSQAVDNSKTVSLSPEEAAAAASAPKPTMGSYLANSLTSNPAWLLPAAGLGGLGAYGLYKLMSARRDAKKRRRLMGPAAIIH